MKSVSTAQVLVFTFAIATLTEFLFGLVPALKASENQPHAIAQRRRPQRSWRLEPSTAEPDRRG